MSADNKDTKRKIENSTHAIQSKVIVDTQTAGSVVAGVGNFTKVPLKRADEAFEKQLELASKGIYSEVTISGGKYGEIDAGVCNMDFSSWKDSDEDSEKESSNVSSRTKSGDCSATVRFFAASPVSNRVFLIKAEASLEEFQESAYKDNKHIKALNGQLSTLITAFENNLNSATKEQRDEIRSKIEEIEDVINILQAPRPK